MNRKSLFRNLTSAVLGAAITACTVSIANAGILTYDSFLNTPLDEPMTDILLYATDGVHEDFYISTDTFSSGSHLQLTHNVDFEATLAYVLGISYAGISSRTGGPRYHLMMFANDAFAADVFARGERFNEVFGVGETVLAGYLQGVHDDPADTASLDSLRSFIHTDLSQSAYFDPYGSFRIIAWSVPAAGDVPAPATIALFGLGLAGLGWSRRKQHS